MKNLLLMAVCLGLLAFGCAIESDNGAGAEDAEPALINHLNLGDEGSVDFYEPVPGEILVLGIFNSGDIVDEIEGKSPPEIYEYLTGETAPEVIQSAYEASLDAACRETAESGDDENIQLPDMAGTRMPPEEFRDRYCRPAGIYDYTYCLLSRTNNYSIIRTASLMVNRVHAYRGNFNFAHRYLDGDSYRTVCNVLMPEGRTLFVYSQGIRTRRMAQIYNATGDYWHLSVYGNN
ncbi:MAG: hypothetical protein JW881_07345 [Spirochaetales bacterium]|nr:hypothetical protein [Spirochaetales bacterium]